MSLNDYDSITLAQFINKLNGYFKHLQEKEEAEWKRVAYISYSILMNNPHVKPNHKPKTFEAYLAGSKKETVKITSEAQLNAFLG